MDDVRAVMDAAGSSSAMLWSGASSTGMAVLFAATYPERCTGLVLFDPRIKGTRAADYPWAPTTEEWRHQLALSPRRMGRPRILEGLAQEWAPEVASNEAFRRLVRLAHAQEPEPGRGRDGVQDRDGARRG